MYDTAIFDLDGTLLNTLGDLATAGNRALGTLGFPAHETDAYRRMVGNGMPILARRMLPQGQRGNATAEVALSLLRKYYATCMWDTTAPYPGIPGVLTALRQYGVRLAVLSNKEDAFVGEIVERFFPGLFPYTMGHREGFDPKPDPASLLALLEEMGADPTRTLYLGDSDVDVFTAHAAGLACCGVLWGFRDEAELRAAGADYIAENTDRMLEVLLAE